MEKVRILVVGQTPPPHGGQAIMIQRLLDGEYDSFAFVHVRAHFSTELNKTGKIQLRKITQLFRIVFEIYSKRITKKPRVFLYHPGGPNRVSMLKDLFILITCKWLFDKTILYFHAAGIGELYGSLSGLMKHIFRIAFFRSDYSVKILDSSFPDPEILKSRRIRVLHIGVPDDSKGIPLATDGKDVLKIPNILFLGAIFESKGIIHLIEACSRLVKKNVLFSLELVGGFESEDLEKRIRQIIENKGLSDRVNIHGILVGLEKASILSKSDIFCLPTFFHAENCPQVIIEAMCFAMPVVATNWRGIPSIVEDERSGFLVPVRDTQVLSERLEMLLRNKTLREKMGACGRDLYLKNFSLEQFYKNHEIFFDDVIKGV